MSKKEEIYEFFAKNVALDRQIAIKRAMKEFEVTETTAVTYYGAWRKDYINPNSKSYINNPIKLDTGRAGKETGTSTTMPVKKEEKIPAKEAKEEKPFKEPEEEKKSLPIKKEIDIKLIPIMFKGPVFTFEINEAGIKIIDGVSDMVTEDIIQEQQELDAKCADTVLSLSKGPTDLIECRCEILENMIFG